MDDTRSNEVDPRLQPTEDGPIEVEDKESDPPEVGLPEPEGDTHALESG